MKKKKLPAVVTGTVIEPFFQSKSGRLLTNWVLQGMLYMNPVETAFKLVLDILLFSAFICLYGEFSVLSIAVCALAAHTVNWVINCQAIALIRHLDWGHNDAEKFISYIEAMYERVQSKPYIRACASYGSLSTGKYHSRSDIDIRFIMKKGLISRVRAASLCFYERFRAFLFRFPLDLYAFDMAEVKKKMSDIEAPVIFYDPEGILANEYKSTVEFLEFSSNFRKIYV